MLDDARESLAKAQRPMKKYADSKRCDVEFEIGEKV